MTIKDLVEEMVEWQKNGFLDPEVWEFLRPKMNPALMPEPSVLQLPPTRPPAAAGGGMQQIEWVSQWVSHKPNMG